MAITLWGLKTAAGKPVSCATEQELVAAIGRSAGRKVVAALRRSAPNSTTVEITVAGTSLPHHNGQTIAIVAGPVGWPVPAPETRTGMEDELAPFFPARR